MNKVLLVGRITRDVELRKTSSGISYARFTVAVTRRFNRDQTDFIPIVAWRNSADFVANNLGRGSLVSIDGEFQSSTYEQNGQKITRYEVNAENVNALESRNQRSQRTTEITFEEKTYTNNDNKNEMKKSNTEDDIETPWELDI